MKNALVSTKNFVAKHQNGIALTVTAVVSATVAYKLGSAPVASMSKFISDKGLTDEYITALIEDIEV